MRGVAECEVALCVLEIEPQEEGDEGDAGAVGEPEAGGAVE